MLGLGSHPWAGPQSLELGGLIHGTGKGWNELHLQLGLQIL